MDFGLVFGAGMNFVFMHAEYIGRCVGDVVLVCLLFMHAQRIQPRVYVAEYIRPLLSV